MGGPARTLKGAFMGVVVPISCVTSYLPGPIGLGVL